MGGVGGFLGGGLVPAPVGGEDVLACADVALVGQHDQPGSGELADDAPDPGRRSGHGRRRAAARTPHKISPAGLEMTCRFIPWRWCLPESNGRSAATRSIGM